MNINEPLLWRGKIHFKSADDNKYSCGHVIILGAERGKTGASKLASISALRSGAGVATIACWDNVSSIYDAWATSVMTKEISSIDNFIDIIHDKRVKAVLLGPGNGINENTKEIVLRTLKLKIPCVLDADAISVFEGSKEELFASLHDKVVLTPHFGEFKRIFDATEASKIEITKNAAKKAGCIILLKGSETVIASHAGNIVINNNAPPFLATAGSGDVLSGIIAGQLSLGVDSFNAACIGAWIHGMAAQKCGIGMISEDLPHKIKEVMEFLANGSTISP